MTREEAIETIRKNWPDASYSQLREALKTVVPELAESEDEEIIRAIIDALYSHTNSINLLSSRGYQMENIEAWLEKQKEPQNKSMAHEDSSWSGILTSPLCKDKNLDDIAQEYVEGVKEYNPTPDWNLIHTAVCYGYHLAEQKEQKPVTKFKVGDKVHFKGDDVNILTITGLREDAYLTDSAYGPILFSDQDEWEIVEQKPSWSEEDRRTIDRACVALRAYANGELPDILPSEILEYADKLQSLRPSWKPSEEQMKAFKGYIEDFQARAEAAVGGWNNFDVMIRLYEDLKKQI